MHSNKNFPRRSKGIKFVKTETKWLCYYIGARGKSRKGVKWGGYCQPRKGGSFFLPTDLIAKYNCIQAFIKAKIDTALLLRDLKEDYGIMVQPKAVDSTLNDWSLAKQESKGDKLLLLSLFSNANKYSCVAYPVNYHVDLFWNKEPSLENKMCFQFARKEYNYGRGGRGPNMFVWALLDWPNRGSKKEKE